MTADVDIVTFGCRLNAYESEVIRARAAEDGLTDAVVFNTCAVTGEAVRQARQAIRKARRERPGARLIVRDQAGETVVSIGLWTVRNLVRKPDRAA